MDVVWIISIGLAFIVEGMIPFLFPAQWRRAVENLAKFTDGQIRSVGLFALICGLAVIWISRLFS
jgi:uncharacterized protein YjeT (DUF2065 family)